MPLRCNFAAALTASIALASLVTVTATSASGAAPTNVQPRAAVSNTTTWAAIKTIATGATGTVTLPGATSIAVNGPDDTVYVVNWLSGDTGSMTVINGTTGSVNNTVALPGYGRAVAVDQNDDTIYTITANSPGVRVQSRVVTNPDDSVSNEPVTEAQFLAVDSLDDTVYVSQSSGNAITYFSGRTPTSPLTEIVGGGTYGIAVDALDDSVWMALTLDDSVRAWNGRTDALGPTIGGVGTTPDPVAVNGPDDTVYAADITAPTIAVINGRTSTLASTLTVPYTIRTTAGLAVDDSTDRLFAAMSDDKALGVINGANTDDSLFLLPRTGFTGFFRPQGVTINYRAVAVDDSGPNQGLVWAAGANRTDFPFSYESYVQAFAQVSPTLQGTTTGAAGSTVTVGVTSTPAVAFDLDDSTVWGLRFNGSNAFRVLTPTPGSGNTWSFALPSGLPTGPVSVEVLFNGNQYALAGTYTVQSSTPPTPDPVFPPGAPTDVVATAGVEEASVSWKAPSYSGSYPITDYQVTSAPGAKSCLVKAPALSCTVAGLTAGTSYTFQARALNGAGWGVYSEPSKAVTPSAPVRLSILITGSRDASDTGRIQVVGTSTGLAGERVTPFVRFPGQTGASEGTGAQTVAADGSFAWSRKTGKKAYVYFAHGSTRSNTVVIPAR